MKFGWWMGQYGGMSCKRHHGFTNQKNAARLDLGVFRRSEQKKKKLQTVRRYTKQDGSVGYVGTKALKNTQSGTYYAWLIAWYINACIIFWKQLTAYICNSAMHIFDMCNCQTISDACPSWKPVAHPVSLHPTQGLPLGLRKACDHDVQWPACGWRGEARGWSPVQGWGGLCFPEHPMEWLARSETFHCFALPAW